MSYPPLQTSQFNIDGTTEFKSKLSICIFSPSLIAIVSMIFLFGVPLIEQSIIDTRIVENSRIDLGFPVISNDTNASEKSLYEKFYKFVYKTTGMESKEQINMTTLF